MRNSAIEEQLRLDIANMLVDIQELLELYYNVDCPLQTIICRNPHNKNMTIIIGNDNDKNELIRLINES